MPHERGPHPEQLRGRAAPTTRGRAYKLHLKEKHLCVCPMLFLASDSTQFWFVSNWFWRWKGDGSSLQPHFKRLHELGREAQPPRMATVIAHAASGATVGASDGAGSTSRIITDHLVGPQSKPVFPISSSPVRRTMPRLGKCSGASSVLATTRCAGTKTLSSAFLCRAPLLGASRLPISSRSSFLRSKAILFAPASLRKPAGNGGRQNVVASAARNGGASPGGSPKRQNTNGREVPLFSGRMAEFVSNIRRPDATSGGGSSAGGSGTEADKPYRMGKAIKQARERILRARQSSASSKVTARIRQLLGTTFVGITSSNSRNEKLSVA